MADAQADPTVQTAPPPSSGTTPATPLVSGSTPAPQKPTTTPPPSAPGEGMAGSVSAIKQAYYDQATHLDEQAKAAISEIGKQGDQLTESMKRIREAQDKADEAQTAATKALAAPPKHPEQDALKKMGGLATVVGMLGGLFTRAPMTASLNAAASAMEAYNKGDEKNYDLAYKQWQTQTDMLFKVAEMQTNRVREIMSDEQMGLNERRTMLDVMLRASGLSQLADAARINGESVVLDWQEKMQSAAQAFQLHRDQIEATQEARKDRLQAMEDAKWTVMTGTDPEGKPVQFRYNASEAKATDLAGKPLTYTPSNVSKAAPGATFTPEMGDLLGSLAARGVALPAGLRSKEQMGKTLQGLIDKYPDKTSDQIADEIAKGQIEFGAQKKETQTAAGIVGKTEVGENELIEFAPQALEASKKVPRGNFVPYNQLIQMGDRNISDPNLKELKSWTNTILNAYDVVAARGGTDKDKRAENRENLITADSPETYERALNVMMKEAEGAKRAAVKATRVPELSTGNEQTPRPVTVPPLPAGVPSGAQYSPSQHKFWWQDGGEWKSRDAE